MKKLLSVLLICFTLVGLSQKSFSKKSIVIDLNANFGIYNTVAQDSSDRAEGKRSTDKAAPYSFALGVEYGVLDYLSVGIKGQTSTYLQGKDTTGGPVATVKGNDIVLVVNGHLVRTKRFDLVFGGNVGYSAIKFKGNDTKQSMIKGGGIAYDLHLTPRLYFSKNFGMYFSLAFAGNSYKKLRFSDNVRKYTETVSLKMSGVNYALGFQLTFGGD
jgi:hypothetical protein